MAHEQLFWQPWKKLPYCFWTLKYPKMCLLLSVWHGHISSSSHLCSIPVLLWIIIRVCDEHQNAFLLKPGCSTKPGRKEGSGLFFFSRLWDFKEDDSWQMPHSTGGYWCCLRTWIGEQGDAHQPLVIVYIIGYSWARSGGCAVCHLASRKWDTMSSIFTLPCLLA